MTSAARKLLEKVTKYSARFLPTIPSIRRQRLYKLPDRHRLQPNFTGTTKGSEENTFPTKDHRLKTSCCFNIEVDMRFECNNATGINAERLVVQGPFDNC